VKAYTSSYAPLDKDIVREAWVRGDLKDRLGVEHRRARRGEQAPMMHARMASASEAEHGAYEPVAPRSPLPPLEKELDVGDGGAQYIVVAERTRSPAPAPGSRMSYYSASDIPPPSPAPPSTRTSRQSASASGALLSPARQEYLARGPHSPGLELREPASPYPRADTSRASERAFATAREDVSAPGSPGAEPPWTGAMAL
jgi:phospholipid-translocating ATPase